MILGCVTGEVGVARGLGFSDSCGGMLELEDVAGMGGRERVSLEADLAASDTLLSLSLSAADIKLNTDPVAQNKLIIVN